MTYTDIQKANATIRTMDIKGKEYAEVPQRIRAFRMVYPDGFILTDMMKLDGELCIIRAKVGFYENGQMVTLGTGTAYEKESSSYINKTSYIENCETSAVGRALGMAGFGIDVSVASAEEVANAIHQQEEQKKPAAKKEAPAPEPVPPVREEKKVPMWECADCGEILKPYKLDGRDIPVRQWAAACQKKYGRILCDKCKVKADEGAAE